MNLIIYYKSYFTHNEWNIVSYNCDYVSAIYKCCPNDRWSVITFDISISRNSENII